MAMAGKAAAVAHMKLLPWKLANRTPANTPIRLYLLRETLQAITACKLATKVSMRKIPLQQERFKDLLKPQWQDKNISHPKVRMADQRLRLAKRKLQ